MNEQQFQFIIEEYKSLKAELQSLVKELRTLETAAIAGIAAVYAWLAKDPANQVLVGAWWIPILFPLLGAFRQVAVLSRIMDLSEYIQLTEKRLDLSAPQGWEGFIKEKRTKLRGKAIALSAFVFWFVLLLITIIVPMRM